MDFVSLLGESESESEYERNDCKSDSSDNYNGIDFAWKLLFDCSMSVSQGTKSTTLSCLFIVSQSQESTV